MQALRFFYRSSPVRIAAAFTSATAAATATCSAVRCFTTTPVAGSGHNRWSKIRHDKGKNDARRGASYSKLSQEITLASREGGTESNLRLNAAIASAKKGQ